MEGSKIISEITVRGNHELDDAIDDVVREMNKFSDMENKCAKLKMKGRFSVHNGKAKKNYNAVLVYMDKMTLSLQLQQSQLLKETKVLEEAKQRLSRYNTKLEELIDIGEGTLNSFEYEEQELTENDKWTVSDWIERLRKKLSDLRISRNVVTQMLLQVDVMISNDVKLVDKIIAVVTGTIPIWRNQITLILGIEQLEKNIKIQKELGKVMDCYRKDSDRQLKKIERNTKKTEIVDWEKLSCTNSSLLAALEELENIETQDKILRDKMNSIIC
jgi:uncharacterized protein YaaN involved in tellurite resistance